MKSKLVEQSGSLRLVESKNLRKGCLGRLEGPCADCFNPTRNNRKYGLQLWKNVFNNDIVKESLATHTLFGELDHPEDRFECLAKNACICMTDYKIDEDAGIVYGGFDILDTPQGRILKSLIDYGSQMGVSSRGEGDIIQGEDGEEVDPDTYDFSCFDVVSTPAVKKARQTVVESVEQGRKKRNLLESIQKEIDNCNSVETLNAIERTVTNADIPNLSRIKRSINNKKSQIVEGKTISSNAIKNKEISKNRRTKTISENINTDIISISELNRKVKAYKLREQHLAKTINIYKAKIDELTTELENTNRSLTESNNKRKQAVRANRALTNELNQSNENIDLLEDVKLQLSQKNDSNKQFIRESKEEIRQLKQTISKLQEQVNSLTAQLDESTEIIESYKSRQKQLKDSLQESQNKLANQKTKFVEQNEIINNQDEDYSDLNNSYTTLENDYNSLLEQFNMLQRRNEELEDVNTSLQEKLNTSLKLNKQYTNSYLKEFAEINGINPNSVLLKESISNPTHIKQLIKEARDRQDKLNKLPISDDSPTTIKILNEDLNKPDEEETHLADFLMSVQNSL